MAGLEVKGFAAIALLSILTVLVGCGGGNNVQPQLKCHRQVSTRKRKGYLDASRQRLSTSVPGRPQWKRVVTSEDIRHALHLPQLHS